MTFAEYITSLKDFAAQNPKSLGMVAVCSGDDEGNSYSQVVCNPTIGLFERREKQFHQLDNEEDSNAVCIN